MATTMNNAYEVRKLENGKYMFNHNTFETERQAEQFKFGLLGAGEIDYGCIDGKWTKTFMGRFDKVLIKAFDGEIILVEIDQVGHRGCRVMNGKCLEDKGLWKKGDHFLGYIKDVVEFFPLLGAQSN